MTRNLAKDFAWPALAGLVLAILGWQTPRDPILRSSSEWSSRPQVAAYPYTARVEDKDGPLELIPERLGRYYRSSDEGEVRVHKLYWKEDQIRLTPSTPPLVVGVCTPPEAAFRVVAEHWVAGEVKLLPEEKEVEIRDGYYRLPPGQYQVMLASEEALPKVMALTLGPGERRDLSPTLQQLPKLPTLPPQAVPSQRGGTPPSGPSPSRPPTLPSTGPSWPSSPPASVQPPSPPPRPPVQQPPPEPQPRPVFTPVSPPQPQSRPAPLFTPVP